MTKLSYDLLNFVLKPKSKEEIINDLDKLQKTLYLKLKEPYYTQEDKDIMLTCYTNNDFLLRLLNEEINLEEI